MKRHIILFAVAASALLAAVHAEDQAAAEKPTDAWTSAATPSGTIHVSVPPGWFVRIESKGATDAVFVSKENIEATGRFSTGLSINRIREISKSKHTSPSQFMGRMAAQYDSTKSLSDRGEVPADHGVGAYIFEYSDATSGVATHYHVQLWYDDSADVACLMIFETSADTWAAEWPIAKRLFVDAKWRQ